MPDDRTWWRRNRRWFVPVAISLPLVMIGLGLLAGAQLAHHTLQGHDAFHATMQALRDEPRAAELLGDPIKPNWLTFGRIDDETGLAELSFTVTGPTRGGGVRSVARLQDDGQWQVTWLDIGIHTDTGGRNVTLISEDRGGEVGQDSQDKQD
jgi:hypothetical protein